MQVFHDIFQIWPTHTELGAAGNAKPDTARKWRKFGRVPQQYWPALIVSAAAKGYQISASDLLRTSAPMKQRGRPAHKSKRRARPSIQTPATNP